VQTNIEIMIRKFFFSIAGIAIGLMLITIITESTEVFLVTAISEMGVRELLDDQSAFLAVRNQPVILLLKLAYTTAAGFIGGYSCAVISRTKPEIHSMILSFIQLLGFVYGAVLSDFSKTLPIEVWFSLAIVTCAAILFAGKLRASRIMGSNTDCEEPS